MTEQNEVMNDLIRSAAGVQPVQQPTVIGVYTRLGENENERTIAFRIPDNLDSMDLLERGATIDGNQAILTVAWDPDAEFEFQKPGCYTCPDLNAPRSMYWGTSLTRVLGDCQRGLVKFFKEHGYAVRFA